MVRRAFLAASIAALTLAAPRTAQAQSDELRIRAARRDTVVARATVTAAFTVTGRRDGDLHLTPRIEVPTDWTVLTGATPFLLRPGAVEMLMLSVAVPARTPAGVYPIRVWLAASGGGKAIADSVLVAVPPRQALDVALLDRPGFVVSGKSYSATFLVRNRSNVQSTVRLSARSNLGSASLPDTVILLAVEESRVIRAHVRTAAGLQSAHDDVLELAAKQHGDSVIRVDASARVTVVPEPSRDIEEYLRVPTNVRLRAASSDGVSPFEIQGRGRVKDGGSAIVDFAFRGPTGRYSAFGERDEYRVDLRAPSWSARAGDQVFTVSPLTASAQPGFGLGGDATSGALSVGGYGQQFRRLPEKGNEFGAFVSARPVPEARLALNVTERNAAQLSGRIGSASAALHRDHLRADLEVAKSQSDSGPGAARSARVSGSTGSISYDAGHHFADVAFSGLQRGARHDYLSARAHQWDPLSLSVNASKHRSDLSRSTGAPYVERLAMGTVAATVFDRYTVEMSSVGRATDIAGVTQQGIQRGVRLRLDENFRLGLVSIETDLGRARDAANARTTYNSASVGARRSIRGGSVSAYVERYSGGSMMKGADGTFTAGGDASFKVNRATDVSFIAYRTRVRTPGAAWHSQLDGQIARRLPNGTTATLRARFMGGGSLSTTEESVVYLEYGVPLRLPVSRLRTPGRVYGKVLDAVTGRGVPGALVRLGPQVAITDRQGQVAFGGVPAGEHRVSLSQEASFADAVFIGDPTLMIDSTRTQPATFTLAVARGARVDINVRRFAAARTAITGAVDSLVDAGPLANATLMLSAERDTLYRTSGEKGLVSFTDVPPGTWTIIIRGDTPAFHRFEPDRIEVTVEPGETKAIAFRLVPRRREVQLIGEGEELTPTSRDPKARTGTHPGAIQTGKPDDKKDHE